jgi:hypothetical protein
MGRRADLEQGYLRTTYKAGFEVRIGDASPLPVPWAFITAYNPRSHKLTGQENIARAKALEAAAGPWTFRAATGVPDDPEIKPEEGIVIEGIPRDEAVSLARRFDQNAIVYAEPGGNAELVWCFPEVE